MSLTNTLLSSPVPNSGQARTKEAQRERNENGIAVTATGANTRPLATPDTRNPVPAGMFRIGADPSWECVRFMSEPSYTSASSKSLLCLLPGDTQAVLGFRQTYYDGVIRWRLMKPGPSFVWVNASLVIPVPPSAPRVPSPVPSPQKSNSERKPTVSQSPISAIPSPSALYNSVTPLPLWHQFATGLGAVVGAGAVLAAFAVWLLGRWKARRSIIHSLAPFLRADEVAEHMSYYVHTKLQNKSPADYAEPGQSIDLIAREPALPKLLEALCGATRKPYKVPFILADSGMGKTTFLINLALQYRRKRIRQWEILVIPLGHLEADNEIAKVDDDRRRRTIVLLDALDEDPKGYGNSSRLTELMRLTWNFHAVAVTCRTQYYRSISDIPLLTGLRRSGPNPGITEFEHIFIAPFSPKDIAKYLQKRFLRTLQVRQWKRAKHVVRMAGRLMARPMLLAHIDVLSEQERKYAYNIEIYATLVDHWLLREADKESEDREAYPAKLKAFSSNLAIHFWKGRQHRRAFEATEKELRHLANQNAFDATSLTEHQISTRSLLNRTNDGAFKFAHKSILEYFLALAAFENLAFAEELRITDYEQVEDVRSFLCDRMRAPFPGGNTWMGSHRELLLSLDNPSGDLATQPFMLVGSGATTIMTCWTSTPAVAIRMVSQLGHLFELCICHRTSLPVSDRLADEWAREIKSYESLIPRVFFHGIRLASGKGLVDCFVTAFTRHDIPQSKLDVTSDQ